MSPTGWHDISPVLLETALAWTFGSEDVRWLGKI